MVPFRTTAVILYLLIIRFLVIIALYLLFPHVSIVTILLQIIILLWHGLRPHAPYTLSRSSLAVLSFFSRSSQGVGKY